MRNGLSVKCHHREWSLSAMPPQGLVFQCNAIMENGPIVQCHHKKWPHSAMLSGGVVLQCNAITGSGPAVQCCHEWSHSAMLLRGMGGDKANTNYDGDHLFFLQRLCLPSAPKFILLSDTSLNCPSLLRLLISATLLSDEG